MCLLNQSQGEGTEVFSWQTAQLILSHNLPRRAGLNTDGQDEPQLSRGGGWNHRATALPQVGTCSSSVACLSPDSPSSSSVLFLFPPRSLFVCSHTRFFFARNDETDRQNQRGTSRSSCRTRETLSVHFISQPESERAFKRKTSTGGSDDRDQLFKLTRSPNATWIPTLMMMIVMMMVMVVVMRMMPAAPRKLLLRFGGFFDALLSLCWSLKLN